jgi:hypothetical protein
MAAQETAPAALARSWRAGDVVGPWRLLRALGRSARSTLFVAESTTGKGCCALRLLPHLVGRIEPLAELERQARAGERVVDADTAPQDGVPWIATALAPLHAVGCAHGDLRPHSVIVAGGELAPVVRVVGFGRRLLRDRDEAQRRANLAWCAPEQTRGGAEGPPADVWTLTLLTFWLLTGHSYWRAIQLGARGRPALLRELLVEPLQLASARAAALGMPGRLPPAFDCWFARGMAREPGERFSEAVQWHTQLAAADAAPAVAIDARAAGAGAVGVASERPGETGADNESRAGELELAVDGEPRSAPSRAAPASARARGRGRLLAAPAAVGLLLALALHATRAPRHAGGPAPPGASAPPPAAKATPPAASAAVAHEPAGARDRPAATGASDHARPPAAPDGACAEGQLDACARLGAQRLGAGDLEHALPPLARACRGQLPAACRQLDRALQLGCDRGQATSCTALAQRYRREPARALALLRRGCAAGDHEACRRLRAQAPAPTRRALPRSPEAPVLDV